MEQGSYDLDIRLCCEKFLAREAYHRDRNDYSILLHKINMLILHKGKVSVFSKSHTKHINVMREIC
jgi:hypothetical protein